jgi:hypothetical protein
MSFCYSGHWCQVNIALVHAIITSSIPSTSFTPTCANTIPAYIAAHMDNVHSLGEHKFLADAKDWDAFYAFLQAHPAAASTLSGNVGLPCLSTRPWNLPSHSVLYLASTYGSSSHPHPPLTLKFGL